MGFFSHCVTRIPNANASLIAAKFVPLVSANYQHSEPFGYIMMGICGLLILINNILFFRTFLFKSRRPFLWAMLMWGNWVYFFQLIVVINHNVNRLQLILGVLHNLYELYITYWNWLAIRNYTSGPGDNQIELHVQTVDKVVTWIFTTIACIFITAQLVVIVLFTDLVYGVYAFYLILLADSFFIASSVACFICCMIRGVTGQSRVEVVCLFVTALGHIFYAGNSLFMCYYPIPTAPIALVANAVSLASVSYCIYRATRTNAVRIVNSGDSHRYHLPGDTVCCL